jgi:hypothetical protein
MPKSQTASHVCYHDETAIGLENKFPHDNGQHTCSQCAHVHVHPRPMQAHVELTELRRADIEAKSASAAADFALHLARREVQLCRARAVTLAAVAVATRRVLVTRDRAVGLASGEYHWCDDLETNAMPELMYCSTAACDDRQNHRGIFAKILVAHESTLKA